jgi:M6 family metalloprotease-like protein
MTSIKDFTKECGGAKPIAGERPLLVILLGSSNPSSSKLNVFLLGKEKKIQRKTIELMDKVSKEIPSDTRIFTLPHQTQDFIFAPAVVNSADGMLQEIFAVGEDGWIYQTFTSAFISDDEWTKWSKIPGGYECKFEPCAINSADGKYLHIFATHREGDIYGIDYDRESGQWGKYYFHSEIIFKSGPTAFFSPDSSQMVIMATGEDGFIYINRFPAGSCWQGWTKLPGKMKFKSGISAVKSPRGSVLNFVVTGEDGNIYYNRGLPLWEEWNKLPGDMRSNSKPSAIYSPDGDFLMIYALGIDDVIYLTAYINYFWTNWIPLPGNDKYSSGPAVIGMLAPKRTPEFVRELLFGPGESVRNYFLENSYGKFTFKEAFISPWLTARDDPSTEDWNESSYEFLYYSPIEKKSSWVVQQVEKLTPFRFRNYDANNDGLVTSEDLGMYWIYPGSDDARGRGFDPYPVPVPSLSKGVALSMLIRGGANASATTIAHELAHQVLNLGDLYEDGVSKGVGPFSLMDADYGNLFQHLDPWSKIKLGWIMPTLITRSGGYSLDAVERSPQAFILFNPDRGNKEYFIVENRWPEGSFEKKLPARGLAIWHINEKCNDFDSRKAIRLVSPLADRLTLWDGSNAATGYDFTSASSPANSNWDDGTPSGISIDDIDVPGPNMRFSVWLSWD